MILDIKYSDDIKILGPLYYLDCYNFWDLKRCHKAFHGKPYQDILKKIKTNSVNLYNGDATMAVVDFDKYKNNDHYLSSLSPNIKRDVKKSSSIYSFKEFNFNDFIPDFCEINQSQAKRKNGINPWYLNPPEFFRCDIEERAYWESHYTKWFGLFRFQKHYKQFEKTTNEKLVAYCQVNVDGEMASIGLVWGHASHYKNGIMFHLITKACSEMMNQDEIKAFVYYGWGQYPEWKKRMLFEPSKINLKI